MFAEEVDFEAFNQRAIRYGNGLSQQQLLWEAVRYLAELLAQLETIPNAAFSSQFKAGSGLPLGEFFERLFVAHDHHHQEQIKAYWARLSVKPKPTIEG
jgi:hypothetical protein